MEMPLLFQIKEIDLKKLAFLIACGALSMALVGCGSGSGTDTASTPPQAPAANPQTASQQGMAPDQTAAANNKSVPTYSSPQDASQGTGYRLAPANPNDPKFKADPRLAGGH